MFDNELQQRILEDFPGASTEVDGTRVTYLDSAASSLKPKAMVDAINEYYLGISCNVHRGKNYMLEQVSDRYELARYSVAELLSCSGNEVVFLSNATEATNLVASGLCLDNDDIVVVFDDAHHSNLLPWMNAATIRRVRSDATGNLDIQHYYELLELKPKVVAITHCSNITGVYSPMEDLIKAAKEIGTITCVDAAQSVPHRQVNVKELDVDFLTFSAHKMAGPTGVGVLYGKKERLEQLAPVNLGGGMVDWVDDESYRLRKIPHRFEAGTPHIAGAYGFHASIKYLQRIGFDKIEAHDKAMGEFMLKLAQERDYLEVINQTPNIDRGGVLSFKVKGAPNLDDAARILSDSYGIMCRNGHLCAQPYVSKQADSQVLRISAYIYTTEEDIQRIFDALDEISPFMFG